MAPDDTVDLLHRWHRGDAAALHRLLEQHLPRLARFVESALGAELRALRAETETSDAVQEAALRVLGYLPRFVPENGEQFQRLLCTFVRNDLRNRLRAPHRQRRSEPTRASSDSVIDLRTASRSSLIPDRAAEKEERRAVLRDLARMALEFLSEDEQRIVSMREFEARGWNEIGAECGLSANAARMRYHRALPRLANHVRRLWEGRIEELLGTSGA